MTWQGSFSSLQDPNKPGLERSLWTFDIPYVIQLSYSYDLPLGRGRAMLGNMPGWAELVIGGWKTNGIWRIADGRPLTFTVSDGNALPTYGTQRPNIVGPPKRNHGSDWVDNYFVDNSVFERPSDFTLGNAPRALGSVRSTWSFTTDLSLGKQFSIREETNLNFASRQEMRSIIRCSARRSPRWTMTTSERSSLQRLGRAKCNWPSSSISRGNSLINCDTVLDQNHLAFGRAPQLHLTATKRKTAEINAGAPEPMTPAATPKR